MASSAPPSDSPEPSQNPSASSTFTIVPAPIATGDQHVCFICLQTDVDEPNATWVKPCPCSLEAHEDCMLRWLAETEQNSGKSKLRCPQCKSPIKVDEPYDSVVAFREWLHRKYSRVTPYALFALVSAGGMAGSAFYGLTAVSFFSGPRATVRWLGLGVLDGRRPVGWRSVLSITGNIWKLSMIGPTLVIIRALPSLGNLIFVPLSVAYSVVLVANDDMPAWPPSHRWAMVLFPYVKLTYNTIFFEFFGAFEKRLNRELRGRPAVEEQPQVQPPPQAGAPRPNRAADGHVEDDEGLWAGVIGLGRAIWGLFADDNEDGEIQAEIEMEVRIGGGDVHRAAEPDEAIVGDELVEVVAEIEAAGQAEERAQQPEQPEQPRAPEQQEQQQPQNQNRPPQQQQQQQQQQGEENRGLGALYDITNSIVTSLIFPAICFGMGELLRLTLPQRWVTPGWRRQPTGLLQLRWGRSFVGGCLFAVLRDAFVLYTKYRRVQVKRNRKIRNVEKKVN